MMGRRWLRAVAGFAVAALFLLLIARRMNWAEVRGVLAAADPWPLLLGVMALAADMTARIVRWWVMLRAAEPELPLARCVRPFLGSLALNNTVPLRAGDVVRVVGFRGTLRAPAAHVLGTLVLERILDLLVLLAILFVGLAGASAVFPRAFVAVAGAAGAMAVLVLVALTLFPGVITRVVTRVLEPLVARRSWGPAALRAAHELSSSLALLRSPGRAVALVGLSVAAWLLEGSMFAAVAWSLHVGVSPLAAWLALGAATLATLLPSSPGYVGTFDYFAMLALTAYGAGRAEAAAFALLAHLVLWLPVTGVGLGILAVGRGAASPAPAPELRADAA
jgi:glycosyltransferase 2 family protein